MIRENQRDSSEEEEIARLQFSGEMGRICRQSNGDVSLQLTDMAEPVYMSRAEVNMLIAALIVAKENTGD